MWIGVLGIVVATVFLVVAVYKGCMTYYTAPIAALILFLFNGMDMGASFAGVFIPGMARTFSSLWFMILCGCYIGQLYTVTGAAESLANGLLRLFRVDNASPDKQCFWGLVVIYLVAGAMSMAGCSAFVCVLMAYPIAMSIMERLQISRRCLAVLAFAPTCFALIMPASPQIYNALPADIMGVSPTAGLIPGIIGGLIVEVGGFFYVLRLMKKERGKGFEMAESDKRYKVKRDKLPNFFLSLLPLLMVFFCFNVLKWPVYAAIAVAVVLMLILFRNYIQDGSIRAILDVLGNSSRTAAFNIGNVCSVAGFGAAVTATPVFQEIIEKALESDMNPLVLIAIVIALLTGASSSASATMNAVLPEFGSLLVAQGASPAAISRVASCAAATLDTLPTNGVVLTVTELTGMKQKDTYFPIAVITVILTTLATVVNVVLLILFPGLA